MAIKTKTSVRMKVAAIAVALIASQSVWARTDWNWQSAVNGDWWAAENWNSDGTTDGNWVIHKNYIGNNDVTVSFTEQGTTANGLWVENGNVGLVKFLADEDDFGVEMGSTWTIGTGTAGNLEIAKGTFTANGVIYVSRDAATSTLTVSGGTIGNKANDLIIADKANANCVGNLVVQNEGVVSVGYWFVAGSGGNSTANITVSGGKLLLGQSKTGTANQGCFNLGSGSGATVNFEQSGGYVYAPGSRNSGTSGQAMVLGNGASTVNVMLSGGTMELDEILLIGNNADADGTFTLSGGTLKVGKIAYGSGTAALNLNGGTIEALKSTTSFLPDTAIAVTVGGDFCISNNTAITIAETIATGEYTLTKRGKGVLTFTGAVSGKINIAEGVCVIPAASLESGNLTVECSGTGRLYIDASSVASGDTVLTFGNAVTVPSGVDISDHVIVKTSSRTLKATFSGNIVAIATDDAAASGVTTVWVGGSDTKWSTDGNWTRGAPTFTDTAVFISDATINDGTQTTIGTLKFANDCTLSYTRGADNSQGLILSSIEGTGTIVLYGAGFGGTSSAALTIPDTIKIYCKYNNKASSLWYANVNAAIEVDSNASLFLGGSTNTGSGSLRGSLAGGGTVRTGGWKLYGDNSNFEGTFNINAKNVNLICRPEAGSAKATWSPSNQWGISRDSDDIETFNNSTFALGALTGNQLFNIPTDITGMTIEIGGKDDTACTISGAFIGNPSSGNAINNNVVVKKVGTNVLHYAAAGVSNLVVAAGTVRLYPNAASQSYVRKDFTAEVKSGATIGGTRTDSTGTLTSLTLADGAAYEVFTTTTTGDDPTTSVDNLTATAVNIEGALVVKMSEETAAAAGSSAADVLTATALAGTVDKQAVVDGAGNPVEVYGESGLYWYAKKAGTAIQIFKRNPKAGFIVIIQ